MNVITHKFVWLKCLPETKLQILYDHVDHTRFHIVEMGCQMVQLLSAYMVGPTMFVNLTPALHYIAEIRAYWVETKPFEIDNPRQLPRHITRLLDNADLFVFTWWKDFSKDFLEVRGLRSRGFELQVEWMTTVLCAEL